MGTVGEALFLYSPVYPVARRSCCVAYDFDLTEGDTMKFLVCIKQVVDTSKMEVDPTTGRLKEIMRTAS